MLTSKEVFLIAALLCFVMFLVLFSVREYRVRGVNQLLAASLLGVAGNLLYAFGRELPPPLAYEFANGVYAAAFAAAAASYRYLFRRTSLAAYLSGAVLALIALVGLFHYAFDSFLGRTLAVSLFQAGIAAIIARTILQARPQWGPAPYPKLFVLAMCALIAGGHAFRALRQMFGAGVPQSLLETSGWNVLLLSAGAFALPVLLMGALQLAHGRIVTMVKDAVNRDFLTGAWSRRTFFEAGERELARARRAARPLAVVLIDLDNFKPINDTFGHAVGDETLVSFVSRLQEQLRPSDVLARMGGDEFAVLMPEADLPGAFAAAERLKAQLLAQRSARERKAELTFSAGIAALQASDTLASLIERADAALYEAKSKGRNQVVAEAKPAAHSAPPAFPPAAGSVAA